MRIGVIIPAWNEEARIGACLRSLDPFRASAHPIIVVDAGSDDETAVIARAHDAQVLRISDRCRGEAIAAGYDAVAGHVDVILIAHADMRFPEDSCDVLERVLDDRRGPMAGVFGHEIADRRRRFRIVEFGNRLRAKYGQLPYGDQAMFVRVDAIEESGGFPRQPGLEDLELALRIRRIGRWHYLDRLVTISARHWERGVIRTTVRNWMIAINYAHGKRETAIGLHHDTG